MILTSVEDRMPKDGDVNCYIIADFQLGNKATSITKINEAISMIHDDPIALVITAGDMTESIHVGDHRFDNDIHDKYKTANKQVAFLAEMMAPIEDKLILAFPGNHERKIKNIVDITEWWVSKLKTDNHIPCTGGVSAKVKFSDDCRMYLHHGSGSVNSVAGETYEKRYNADCIKIRRKLRLMAGDCHSMYMAHIHKLRLLKPKAKVRSEIYLTGDTEIASMYYDNPPLPYPLVHEDDRYYGSTGSFLRSVLVNDITYSEEFMYHPLEMGMLCQEIRSGKISDVKEIIV